MLPTSGYFRGVSCPDYEKGRCPRPFCHFHHHPRRETNTNQLQSITSNSENADDRQAINDVSQPKIATEKPASEDLPTCSKSETSAPKKGENAEEASDTETSEANSGNQSELLQQLVSDAVKKALSENPLLAAAGVDPSSVMKKIDTSALIAQASAEITQTKTKKKLYLRPPDTPSYNPTPIEELNKRKRSVEGSDKEATPSKVMKYVPSNMSASSVISDVLEGEVNTKSSVDSEATDFSSDDGEGDKKRDDFDILEEVLAEHSQNNKIKVKKKRVRALGKLQYNLSIAEKTSKNSTVISDAQCMSNLDSSSCDTSKKNSTESQDMAEGSYFLPPSPVFTSSSDGFGMFNSTVYTTSKTDSENCKTSENVPGKEEKEMKEKEEKEINPVKVNNPIQKSEVSVKPKEQPSKDEVKNKSKGHSLLPQVVHTLSAPKISRRNIRSWTPQVRSTVPEVKDTGDPLEEILQLMDGEDSQQTADSKEDSKKTQQRVEASKIVKKYKVDLDKEILSLSNLSSNKVESQPPPSENSSQEKLEVNTTTNGEKQKTKNAVQGENSKEEQKKLPDKETETKDSQSEKKERKSESESEDPDLDSEDEEDDPEKDEKRNKENKGGVSAKDDESSDSEHRRGRHRRKRKRDRSSSSDSEHSYHRRKKKKSHKRRRKYSHSKKKRKHRNSRGDSDDEDSKDSNRDEEDSADEKSDASREDSQDEELDKVKKHKKHKKRGKHHKKYKYKRRRSKSKKKRNRSHSSSRSSSRSSSESRSRSRSRSHSRSRSESRDRSRSRSQSQSPGKRKNKDNQKIGSRRESEDSIKRRNSTSDSQGNTKDKTQPLSVPMPVDPSKIKIEKDPTVPDLSIVKIEKDLEQTSSISGKKEETESHGEKRSSGDSSTKQERSSHSKPSSDIASKESEKAKQGSDREHKKSRQDRKSSTDSMSDKGFSQRRQSTESKKSENESISGSSKQGIKRRVSDDSCKKENSAQDSQGKVMSMFDMVIASTQQVQKPKVLKEISIFDAVAAAGKDSSEDSTGDDIDSTEPFLNDDSLNQKSDTSSKGKSGQGSKTEKSVDRSSSSSSRKDNKNESKRKHSSSSSKEKSSSHKSSSSHHSSSSSKHKSSSNSSKHSNTTVSSSTSSSKETHSSKTKEKSGVTSSSHSSGNAKHHSSKHSSSSKSQKSSNSSSSSRKHSSGSHSKDKEHSNSGSSSSKADGKIKESSRSKRYSTENEASNGICERDSCNDGNDSPLPDLSALDEIPQDDWEQMINSSDRYDLQHLENLDENDEDYDLDDLDKDDPAIMEECMRMFNEYQPEDSQPQMSSKKTKVVPKEEPESHQGKQRVARSSTGNLVAKKPEKGPRRMTPAQVMMERYQKLKEQQAELMKQLKKQKQQIDEQNRGRSSSSSAVSSTTSSRPSTFPASSSTTVKSPPISTSGGSKRRISHVPNVSSLLHAREKIKNLPPTNTRALLSPSVAKASGNLPQTIAHTVAKGSRRTAHVPQAEALSRPVIPAEFGSKVPQNIRQRYLNSFIDECLKFTGEKTAFRIAMAEERVCYNRASSRMVYLNLAVNTLKRLRTQQAAGEAAQELIDSDPQFGESSEPDEPSTSTKPSSSVSSPAPSRTASQHPLNPNHVRLSHFSVLAVGGQKGSWSIEKPKKNTVDVSDCLKGLNFYKLMKKYLLTEEQLRENGYPLPDPDEKGKAIVAVKDTRKKLSPSAVERYCDRCSVLYKVDKWGFPTTTGPCAYHWGRAYKRRGYSGLETRYSCCGGDLESDGCVQATTHVSQNYNPDDLRGYVRTLPKDVSGGDYGVYALDCEMCYTTAGNELTRVTVIDSEGKSIYEQLVKPENPIIDYNTRFSGITESDMEDVRTTLFDVQAALLTRFSDKTILVGHSLESDFQALKLIHDTVVDTSVVFPHKMGHPYKRALRNLASEILKKIIQNDVSGHDSAEDAVTCMHLMQWKIKEDLKRIKK